ncbi:nectin-1-like isoform X2 [Heterodontus francisci]|uniref:nectin-1-like isoform X2 n=1 Tax=Heterodontus francisci TaxID=7792 RepID=UPI00355B45D0
MLARPVLDSKSATVRESLTALVGNEVLLPCQILTNNTNLTQLSWKKASEEKPFMVYNRRWGITFSNEGYSRRIVFRNHSLKDGSIIIKALDIQDEGNYSCQLKLYPQGIQTKIISLTVLDDPEDLNTTHIVIIVAVIICVVVIVLTLTLTWRKRRIQEIDVHQDANSSQTQKEQRIDYASLHFNVPANHFSAQREEESTVYADVKYNQI